MKHPNYGWTKWKDAAHALRHKSALSQYDFILGSVRILGSRFARAVAAKNHFCTSADNSSSPLAVTTRNDGSAEPNENERQCARLGSYRRLARRPRNWSRSTARRQRTPYKYRRDRRRDRRVQFRFVVGRRRRHFWGCHGSGSFPEEFPGDLGKRFRLGRNKIRHRRFFFGRQDCAWHSWRQDPRDLVAAYAEIHIPSPVGEDSCARRNEDLPAGPMNHLSVLHLPVGHITVQRKRGLHQIKSFRIDAGKDRLPERIP